MDNNIEIITNVEATELKRFYKDFLIQYKEKDGNISDAEWLEKIFVNEIPEITKEEAEEEAKDIVNSIEEFDKNLESVNKAALKGISKEKWFANKIEETSANVSTQEFVNELKIFDDYIYTKNEELANALTVPTGDGNRRVNMNPNLDGILAENLIAKTADLSALAQGKNVRVEVRGVNSANSVDLRVTNFDTGKYQNYQLKFGKDAQATIALIERGNYNNQRIIVPTEQLKEIQDYFKKKGSNKTITDCIDAFGVKGKKCTKSDLKELANAAQNDGLMPSMDYNDYSIKDLSFAIGKKTGVAAIQSVALSTSYIAASKLIKGEELHADELVEVAIKTGKDTAVKTVTAGALQVATRKGIIKCIPRDIPGECITNIACVGVENAKVLSKVASGELTVTQGVDQMGRTTTSSILGLWCSDKARKFVTTFLKGIIKKSNIYIATVVKFAGFVSGMVGYSAGSKTGDGIYSAAKKVCSVAKTTAKVAWEGIKNTGRKIADGIKNVGRKISRLFNW